MAAIGAVSCDFVRGRPPETYGPFALRVVLFDSGANVETWFNDLEALGTALDIWRVPGLNGFGVRAQDGGTPAQQTIVVDDGASFDKCVIGTIDGSGVTVLGDGKRATREANTDKFVGEVQIEGIRIV